jgi:hypothetical protein
MHPLSPQLHLVAVKGGTRELFSAFASPTVGDKKKPLTTTLHARQFPFGYPICLFAIPLLPVTRAAADPTPASCARLARHNRIVRPSLLPRTPRTLSAARSADPIV